MKKQVGQVWRVTQKAPLYGFNKEWVGHLFVIQSFNFWKNGRKYNWTIRFLTVPEGTESRERMVPVNFFMRCQFIS